MSQKKEYTMSALENISIDNLPDDAVVVLDDRPRKFDEIASKFVRPGEPGYDGLPDINR